MLRGTEKWVTYFVLVVIFIFGVVFLAKQIGVTTDLKQSLAQAKASGMFAGDLRKITHLHNASAKVFFLSFFSLCLLLIGIVIVMRGIQRAYDIAEVKEKVRHHLKATTPGVVLVILASFLLAFCTYRASHIETVYSSRLVDYNNFKVAMQGMGRPDQESLRPRVDTSALARLKNATKKAIVDVPDIPKRVSDRFSKKSQRQAKLAKQNPSSLAPKEKVTPAKRAEKPVTAPKQPSLAKTPAPAKTSAKLAAKPAGTKAKVVAQNYPHLKKGSVTQPTKPETPKAVEKPAVAQAISQRDIDWALQFQHNVTIFGYVPTPAEEARFNRIYGQYEQSGAYKQSELHWAYSFLQKTKRGYEPKPGEMRRFEEIVMRNASRSAGAPRKHSEL